MCWIATILEAIPNRVGDSLKKFKTTFNLNRSISGHMNGQKLAQRRFSFTRNPRTVQVFERQMVLKFDTEFAQFHSVKGLHGKSLNHSLKYLFGPV